MSEPGFLRKSERPTEVIGLPKQKTEREQLYELTDHMAREHHVVFNDTRTRDGRTRGTADMHARARERHEQLHKRQS